MPHTRSLFVALSIFALLAGCDEREAAPSPPAPRPPPTTPFPSAAEVTGWPAGFGRALVVRITSPEEAYRLVVPELGDRRYADSAISLKAGDSLPVALLGFSGRAGDAQLRIVDREAGTGSCVTWPAAEITGASYVRRAGAAAWRVAMERDSVTPVTVDSLAGMNTADSASLTRAIHSLMSDVPALSDSTLRGIPFAVLRAYRLHVGEISVVAAELARTSGSEADPREQRLFLVGERVGDSGAHQHVFSQDVTGPADNTPMTELLAAVVSLQSRRPVLVLGVEGASGLRLHLLERVGRRQWRRTWSSVVSFC